MCDLQGVNTDPLCSYASQVPPHNKTSKKKKISATFDEFLVHFDVEQIGDEG